MAYTLDIPEPLLSLIKYCETHCVAECCGIDAFEISAENIKRYVAEVGLKELEHASAQVKGLAVLFKSSTTGGSFSNSVMNHAANVESWGKLFGTLEEEIQKVLDAEHGRQ